MFQLFTKEHSGSIRFSWQQQPDATGYHFMLARDSNFKDLVVDKAVPKNHFDGQHLLPGTYYWRVGLKGAPNQPISFSAARRLEIVRDLTPPPLWVELPTTAVCDQAYMFSGRTEPGANVFIGGYRANVTPSGDFEYVMRLSKDKNVIAVAATDAANNVTSKSRIVICK
jgi:hypothetical protein